MPPKRLYTHRLCQFLADQAGAPFHFPPAYPFRSLEAMRGLAPANGPGPAAVRAAFEHIWAHGGDPAALPGSTDHPAKERLRAWTAETVAAGVFGVPSLMIAGEVFWGLDAIHLEPARITHPSGIAPGRT